MVLDKPLHHPSDKTYQFDKVFWMRRLIMKRPIHVPRDISISLHSSSLFSLAPRGKILEEKQVKAGKGNFNFPL